MARMKFVLALCVLAFPALAQDGPDFDALDKELKYRLTDEGAIEIFPDPFRGDGTGWRQISDMERRDSFMYGGITMWMALAFPGASDIASLANGGPILERLGLATDDASLLGMIENEKRPLLRLMAMRTAQDRGFKPAIGVLERSIESGIDDALVARAAREVAASLRGATLPVNKQLPTIESLLAKMAEDTDIVVKIDHYRMPSARPMLEMGCRIGLEITKDEIRKAGGTVSSSQWAGATKMSLGPGVFPYELARALGNHRLDRMLVSVKLDLTQRREPEPIGQIHVDGAFQTAKLHEGLRELEPAGSMTFEDGTLTIESAGGTFVMQPNSADATVESEYTPLGESAAKAVAAAVEADDAPIVVYLTNVEKFQEVLGPIANIAIPKRLGIWVPQSKADPIRFSVECTSANAARSLGGLMKSLLRTFDQLVSSKPGTEKLDPLLEAVDEVEIQIEGASITGMMSISELDVTETLMALIETGLLR